MTIGNNDHIKKQSLIISPCWIHTVTTRSNTNTSKPVPKIIPTSTSEITRYIGFLKACQHFQAMSVRNLVERGCYHCLLFKPKQEVFWTWVSLLTFFFFTTDLISYRILINVFIKNTAKRQTSPGYLNRTLCAHSRILDGTTDTLTIVIPTSQIFDLPKHF